MSRISKFTQNPRARKTVIKLPAESIQASSDRKVNFLF